MLIEGASRIVASRHFEVDSNASQLGSASLYGSDKGSSDTFAPLIGRYPKVTHPYTLLTCVRFESSAKRRKANNTICAFGNKTFEPPVSAEGAV